VDDVLGHDPNNDFYNVMENLIVAGTESDTDLTKILKYQE